MSTLSFGRVFLIQLRLLLGLGWRRRAIGLSLIFVQLVAIVLFGVILGVTILLFLWNKLPVELVAILSMLTLVLLGVLEPSQALEGFANPTVITIAALFVVGAGLYRTGVADWIAQRLIRFGGESETRLMVILVLMTAVLSALVSSRPSSSRTRSRAAASVWRRLS